MTCSSTRGIAAEPATRGLKATNKLLIDSYESPGAESLLRLGRERYAREHPAHRLLFTEATLAAALLTGAALLAALASSPRGFTVTALAVTVVTYLIAQNVHYPVGSAWTAPTQLAFVPMLFILPTPFVPLIVAACSVAGLVPAALRGRLVASRLLARVGDSSYALGAAAVLVAFHAQQFSWDRWPVLLLAFGAQIACDAGAGLSRTWFAEQVSPRMQLAMLWVYATDACLSCIGLLAAAAAVGRPALVLLVLPLVGLQQLMAHERQQRLEYSLALGQEHRIALELQRGLLPKHLPQIPGIELAAHYQAAGEGAEAGGDWYDAFGLPDGQLGVVVGDVTGRGLAAASTMGQLRSVTRAFALGDERAPGPGSVLTRVNRYQRALDDRELFSLVYAVIDPDRTTVRWASGGHPPPLVRGASGEIRFLEGAGALMSMTDSAYPELADTIGPGDTLILYSDGLVERRGESLDVGLQRLAGAAATGPTEPAALSDHILAAMMDPLLANNDDVTLILVRVAEADGGKPGDGPAF
jgi:serine phosphatase RsbU (regulator of sigma subunit)